MGQGGVEGGMHIRFTGGRCLGVGLDMVCEHPRDPEDPAKYFLPTSLEGMAS